MLLSIVNILLSPFSFLLFILLSSKKESYFFTKEETNVTKLKLIPYLFFAGIYLSIILSLTYVCSVFIDFNIWEVFLPKNIFISVITWLITASTLRAYLKGMEGNIMGFIFFPLLAISMFTLFVFSFLDIISSYQFLTFNFPVLKLNFWIRLLLHSFMPFYILIFLNSNKNTQDKNNDLPTLFLSILILQFFFFGINWTLVYLFGSSLSISKFFGEGQTIVYYLPMLGGFLYFLLFFISKITSSKTTSKTSSEITSKVSSEKGKQNILETLSYYSMLLIFGGILLEMLNYLNLIIPFFQ